MGAPDIGAAARDIIDRNLYMTLATADRDGRPWASPVYYAHEGYIDFHWVSSLEATHSRNLAARPEVGIVVFDSGVPIGTGTGHAVYMTAAAAELEGDELARAIEVFSRRTQSHGGRPWTLAEVGPPSLRRLYRARVTEHSMLDSEASDGDRRMPVDLS